MWNQCYCGHFKCEHDPFEGCTIDGCDCLEFTSLEQN
jgi:hypothetical protein